MRLTGVRRDGIEYYRWQAERCRELAERQTNNDVKARLLKAASEYEKLILSGNPTALRTDPTVPK